MTSKLKHYFPVVLLFILFISCKTQKGLVVDPNSASSFSKSYQIAKRYDKPSNTYYYLTRIKHLDQNG